MKTTEELKLLPCPHCGHEQPAHFGYDDSSWVECVSCGMRGPGYEDPRDAEEAWNVLPRRLLRTKKKPTENGWYCYFRLDGEWAIGYLRGNCLNFPGGEYVYLDNAPGEFAGPIPEPEEAE